MKLQELVSPSALAMLEILRNRRVTERTWKNGQSIPVRKVTPEDLEACGYESLKDFLAEMKMVQSIEMLPAELDEDRKRDLLDQGCPAEDLHPFMVEIRSRFPLELWWKDAISLKSDAILHHWKEMEFERSDGGEPLAEVE